MRQPRRMIFNYVSYYDTFKPKVSFFLLKINREKLPYEVSPYVVLFLFSIRNEGHGFRIQIRGCNVGVGLAVLSGGNTQGTLENTV